MNPGVARFFCLGCILRADVYDRGMRFIVWAAIAAGLAAGQAGAGLEGQVKDSAGAPVANATIRLRVSPTNGAVSIQQGAATATAADGTFAFKQLAPGRYELTAQKDGFLTQTAGSPLSLAPEQQLQHVNLTMIRGGSISGRVLDENGDLYPGGSIAVFQKVISNGRVIPREATGIGGRSSQGEFRYFGIPPGEYFLAVFPEPGKSSHVRTYYPNATNLDSAGVIRVLPGSDLTGLDVRLGKEPTVSVRGRIVGSDIQDRQAEGPRVNLVPRDFPSRFPAASIARDGAFEFAGVAPGEYTLTAMLFNTVTGVSASGQVIRGPRVYGWTEIAVADRDLTDIQLAPPPAFDLRGRVMVEEGAPGQPNPAATRRIVFDAGAGKGVITGQVQGDGSFVLAGLVNAIYEIRIPAVPGTYPASVRMGTQEITTERVDLRAGAPSDPLVITYGASPGRVTGVVTADQGQAVTTAIVTLVPARGEPPWLYRRALTDQNGQFVMDDLAPSEYRVDAWKELAAGKEYDPAFRETSSDKSVVVSVEKGSPRTVILNLR